MTGLGGCFAFDRHEARNRIQALCFELEAPARLRLTALDANVELEANLPCRKFDPDLWFAEAPAELELAKSLCGGVAGVAVGSTGSWRPSRTP